MTKLVKLSLAAAIAVSGLSSTVAAKPLEEAIKGVDISGTVVYRYDDRVNDEAADSTKAGNSTTGNHYKVAVDIKAPVNDIVTFQTRVIANEGFDSVGEGTQAGADANPTYNLTEANFVAKTGMLTTIVGKQGLPTPWTVSRDADGDENTGTGIIALADAGIATFAAAYFNQTNTSVFDNVANITKPVKDLVGPNAAAKDDGARDLAALAIIAPLGPVNFSAWYVDLEDAFDSYTIAADANIMDMVNVAARYSSLDPDTDYLDVDTQKVWDIKVSGDLGPVGLSVRYANVDEDGGIVSLNQTDAATDVTAWNINVTNNMDNLDADFWHVSANMDLMPGLNFALNYATVDAEDVDGADVDEDELFGQLTYNMSDNFSTYFRYGTYDKERDNNDEIDQTRGRLQVQYSF